ncbi:MAG TPA: 3-oxoacyl-ACP reductase FabG [Kofleriaceae bacterium]|jgi:3-oxoacyl-[acyl-carrier protein] reductase|nr:3-oxoacyl-ACP reductase FabG [Kofleriaceae bacterium]
MNEMDGSPSKPFDRWALVTGGSRGIGAAIVQRLARSGFRVAFTYQSAADTATQLVERLTAEGAKVTAVQCDGTKPEAVEAVVNSLVTEYGAPFALINNAGITRDELLMKMKPSDVMDVLATNLGAAFHFGRAVIPSMIAKRDGVILQMSSVGGVKGNVGQTGYSASKAGLIGFTRSLALETARFNVRVNAIAPGFIATDMVAQMPPAKRDGITKQVPLRRIGTVDEIAGVVEFLMSPAAAYITGQTIVVDGGMTA